MLKSFWNDGYYCDQYVGQLFREYRTEKWRRSVTRLLLHSVNVFVDIFGDKCRQDRPCWAQPWKNGATRASPQLCMALLSFPEPVALHAQSPKHSPNSQCRYTQYECAVVCILYCDWSSDQQVSSSRNLKGLEKLIIIIIYTKHNH